MEGARPTEETHLLAGVVQGERGGGQKVPEPQHPGDQGSPNPPRDSAAVTDTGPAWEGTAARRRCDRQSSFVSSLQDGALLQKVLRINRSLRFLSFH